MSKSKCKSILLFSHCSVCISKKKSSFSVVVLYQDLLDHRRCCTVSNLLWLLKTNKMMNFTRAKITVNSAEKLTTSDAVIILSEVQRQTIYLSCVSYFSTVILKGCVHNTKGKMAGKRNEKVEETVVGRRLRRQRTTAIPTKIIEAFGAEIVDIDKTEPSSKKPMEKKIVMRANHIKKSRCGQKMVCFT